MTALIKGGAAHAGASFRTEKIRQAQQWVKELNAQQGAKTGYNFIIAAPNKLRLFDVVENSYYLTVYDHIPDDTFYSFFHRVMAQPGARIQFFSDKSRQIKFKFDFTIY